MRGTGVAGRYAQAGKDVSNPTAGGTGEASKVWQSLKQAFKALEGDFARLDINGDTFISRAEIAQGVPATKTGKEKMDILTRLSYAWSQVDIDGNGYLDFFEFVYLGFLMTQNGSYHDLIEDCTNAGRVKRAYIDIHGFYTKYDLDHNNRLTWDEVESFANSILGCMPASLPNIWQQVKYQSSATGGRDCVDVVRFMKMLYLLICPWPEGQHAAGTDVVKPQIESNVMSVPKAEAATHLPRIDPVIPSRFTQIKVLGQGGQGKVCLGTYAGVDFKVAGKTFLGAPDANLVKETLEEVAFFMQLDHPNCHYMLGSKTTLDDGGIMLLTEVCDMGSIFDLYSKEGKVFDPATAWRLSRECALGFGHIHLMGYMHRDIKSLNVFLSANFVAKVADFGMCTNSPQASDMCGTPQWMAPEVGGAAFGVPKVYDKSVDVYSYAILMWELFHSQTPYWNTGLDQMGILQQVCCASGPHLPLRARAHAHAHAHAHTHTHTHTHSRIHTHTHKHTHTHILPDCLSPYA